MKTVVTSIELKMQSLLIEIINKFAEFATENWKKIIENVSINYL